MKPPLNLARFSMSTNLEGDKLCFAPNGMGSLTWKKFVQEERKSVLKLLQRLARGHVLSCYTENEGGTCDCSEIKALDKAIEQLKEVTKE